MVGADDASLREEKASKRLFHESERIEQEMTRAGEAAAQAVLESSDVDVDNVSDHLGLQPGQADHQPSVSGG